MLAWDMYVYRIRKYIGAYYVALGGHVDALVFSAGVGENSAELRAAVCDGLQASVLLTWCMLEGL
jgi:acetate kinase